MYFASLFVTLRPNLTQLNKLTKMKKILFTLVAVVCCAMLTSVCTSCRDDDHITYTMGLDGREGVSEHEAEEITLISSTFRNNIQQTLGVTISGSTFNYNGSDTKVKEACDKAATELNTKKFNVIYTYSVYKQSNANSVLFYRWKNSLGD